MTHKRIFVDLKKTEYRAIVQIMTPETSMSKVIRLAIREWLAGRHKNPDRADIIKRIKSLGASRADRALLAMIGDLLRYHGKGYPRAE